MEGVSTIARITVRAPREWFFHWFLNIDLSRIMHRYAFLPPVVATTAQTGPMHVPGTTRIINFSDGSTALEQVTSCDPPEEITYRVSRLTSEFRHLVKEGSASITFRDSPAGGTVVQWKYTFESRSTLAGLILRPLVSTIWRGFMQAALVEANALAEAEAPNSGTAP